MSPTFVAPVYWELNVELIKAEDDHNVKADKGY